MDDRNSSPFSWVSDEILEHIFSWICEPLDRRALSEVCKRWFWTDARTRKNLTIGFAYAASPSQLSRRFNNLLGLKIKGRPRVSEFGLVSNDWGGYSHPWTLELVEAKKRSGAYAALSSLHFKRLKVSDEDLSLLAQNFYTSLRALNLQMCNGFSTRGLLAITRACRFLQVLDVEESQIEDHGSEWLHELSLGAPNLEVLSLFLTSLDLQHPADLVALVNNCKSLRSLRLNEVSSMGLLGDAFSSAKCLRDLSLSFGVPDRSSNLNLKFPRTLTSLAGDILFPLDGAVTSNLVELDLMSTALNAEEQMELIKCCPNLEVLKLRNIIGDAGVAAAAQHCSRLRSIRIENLEENVSCSFSHLGVISLASGCLRLQQVAIYVSDITNSALQTFGENCPNLLDFRVAILESAAPRADTHFPLDSGVKALLKGCRKITRLGIYLRPGGLSDEGMAVLGSLGQNLTWLLLGYVGYSDFGFIRMASGCRKLLKLEMRGCPFSETGIAMGLQVMSSLKLVWIQKYLEVNPYDLLHWMGEWIVEYIVSDDDEKSASQIVAYKSATSHRADYPPYVIPLSRIAGHYYASSSSGE